MACAAIAVALALPAPAARAAEPPPENVLITLLRGEAASHEHGDGVPRDGQRAATLYCEAARMGDAESQYSLGWMYANGRGVERSDSLAAFFFHAAAEQGHEQALRMLQAVGGPSSEVPSCMREPVAPAPATAPAAVAPARIPAGAPGHIVELVQRLAPEYRVWPALALAIIEAESNFDSVALSPRNAKGLMQLIPETAARFQVRNPYDPAQNIRGGLAYLRWLLAYFEGDVRLVAAAYNAGEGTVERYRGVPPYVETRAYVRRILAAVGAEAHPFDAGVARPSAALRRIREARGGS
ncbi:transglycosylase SLT domain-containing protein [Aquabacterium sp. A7-Y]|uniref:transglycosylase SLT domain-containing protein n=1 Tax=Aquabacterium sp. A7-Y TaxID=1349605 RepID=UPI00223CD054|nr:transglycosylase SLT domain-containing protein [Aquabacterium sp. A7-Y]MCW7539620.1 transglycosylase SLT domain-containing protein [Aquabacterium sp. A7-Y]